MGAAMWWKPHEVRACTLLDFEAAIRGWLKSRGIDDGGPDTSDAAVKRLDELMERYG